MLLSLYLPHMQHRTGGYPPYWMFLGARQYCFWIPPMLLYFNQEVYIRISTRETLFVKQNTFKIVQIIRQDITSRRCWIVTLVTHWLPLVDNRVLVRFVHPTRSCITSNARTYCVGMSIFIVLGRAWLSVAYARQIVISKLTTSEIILPSQRPFLWAGSAGTISTAFFWALATDSWASFANSPVKPNWRTSGHIEFEHAWGKWSI